MTYLPIAFGESRLWFKAQPAKQAAPTYPKKVTSKSGVNNTLPMIRNAIVITSALPNTNLLQPNSTDLFRPCAASYKRSPPIPDMAPSQSGLAGALATYSPRSWRILVPCATDFRTGSSAAVAFLPRIPTLLMNITRRSSNAFQLPWNQDLKVVTALTWSPPACFFQIWTP